MATGAQKLLSTPIVPPGRASATALLHRVLYASRVEDHVVVGSDRQGATEPLGCLHAIGAVGGDVWGDASGGQRGDGAQPDRPGTDDEDPHAVLHAGPVDAVHRHGQRLDQAGVLEGERLRQGPGAGGVDPGGIGHAAVAADAVHGAEGLLALLLLAGQAPVAPTAPHDRQHGDGGAIVETPGEFVAEGHGRRAERHEVHVGPADAGRGHRHPHRTV